MISKLAMILLGVCLGAFPAHANTINAASTSLTDVTQAVNSASSGDTVIIPAGTASWDGTVSVSKGITIQGAGSTSTVLTNASTVTGSGTAPLFSLDDGGTNTTPRRITGIGMKGSLINSNFNKAGKGVYITGWLSQKRVDHCRFDDLYSGLYIANSNGVSDHNAYYNCATEFRHVGVGSQQQYAWDNFRPLAYDSLNYFFHEDETVEVTGDALVADEVEACSWAIRHCTITLREAHGAYTSAQSFPLFDCHGDNPASLQYSALTTLLYENDITINNGAAMSFFALRGGAALAFNNRVVTAGGSGNASVSVWDENYYYEQPTCQNGGSCQWPHWANPLYYDAVGGSVNHGAYVFNNTYNGVVQGPGTGNGGANVTFATNPGANPTANVWTNSPSPLVTPPYPHPLVTGGPLPTPTPQPTATPAPTATPSPTPIPIPLGMSFPSTDGDIANPFVINPNSISQPTETVDPAQGGRAFYTFSVPTSGDYLLSALVNCPDGGSNSLFVNIDAEPSSAMVWNIPVTSGPENRLATWSGSTTPKVWTLNAGTHQLIIRGREANTILQHITLGIAPHAPERLLVTP